MGYILKYYRNHNLFLVCVISSRGNYKSLNCTSDDDFGVCLHLPTASQVRLQKFVVCAFLIRKVCSVRFLGLQKSAMSAFLITKL
jgi:hypothetical protein